MVHTCLRRSIIAWIGALLSKGQYLAAVTQTRQAKANRSPREVFMVLKSSALLMRSLVVAAFIAATSVPTVRNYDAGAATIPNQARTDQSASAPIVVAQGRCFNGRCY
jgi:hypothetical protein